MKDRLQWGILGTGHIAGVFADSLAESKTGDLLAIASRSQETADRFGDQFKVERRYSDYESLLADPDVDVVYITTPHPMHEKWAMQAAKARKHILCEKPLAMNFKQAKAIIDAARSYEVFLMEAFMYRCHYQTRKIVELIRDNVLGNIHVIHCAFSFRHPYDLNHRVLNSELGGGGILDVGCYPVSMSRLIAGVAAGMDFAEPSSFAAEGYIGQASRVDEYTVAIAKFPGDVLAQLSCGVQVDQENVVRIFGTDGSLYIPQPWQPGRGRKPAFLYLTKRGMSQIEEIQIDSDRGLWTIQADLVAENIHNRQAPPPAMTWQDSLGNMRMLDLWRKSIGMTYSFEDHDVLEGL